MWQQLAADNPLLGLHTTHLCIVDHSIKVLDVAQTVTTQFKAVGNKAHAIVPL